MERYPLNELRIGEALPSGTAYYGQYVMPYWYVSQGIIMYDVCDSRNGEPLAIPSLEKQRIREENLGRTFLYNPRKVTPAFSGTREALSIAVVVASVACAYYFAGPLGAMLASKMLSRVSPGFA